MLVLPFQAHFLLSLCVFHRDPKHPTGSNIAFPKSSHTFIFRAEVSPDSTPHNGVIPLGGPTNTLKSNLTHGFLPQLSFSYGILAPLCALTPPQALSMSPQGIQPLNSPNAISSAPSPVSVQVSSLLSWSHSCLLAVPCLPFELALQVYDAARFFHTYISPAYTSSMAPYCP